jgi:hypothetical protein
MKHRQEVIQRQWRVQQGGDAGLNYCTFWLKWIQVTNLDGIRVVNGLFVSFTIFAL